MILGSPGARTLGLAALLLLAAPAQAHDANQGRDQAGQRPAAPSGEALPFALGGPFSLIDHEGRPRSREDFHGEYRIIYFGYSKCPYTCSTAASNIAVALDDLADNGHDVGGLFITIDPAYDTPERLAAYVARIHPNMLGLTGDMAEIDRVQRSFQVHAREAADKGGFQRLFEHPPLAVLMGPQRDILTLFPPILPPAQIVRIIEGYM